MTQRIPGFRSDLPRCGENWPTGWAYSYCPMECNAHCWNKCEGSWNPTRCAERCEEECMNECLFVPCCTPESLCDDGVKLERESCQFSYYGGMEISSWRNAGGC
ncbi:hypothetical protein [Streptomyces xanthophaeus]|uniref:hypothetical protein n=1 Tax=Streptomyces xanthophaeus TaxID=67385 RepID=UPI00371A6013